MIDIFMKIKVWFLENLKNNFNFFLVIILSFILLFSRKFSSKFFTIDLLKHIKPEVKIPIFREISHISRKIERIELEIIINEQMLYVKEQKSFILERLIKIHRHILKSKGLTERNVHNHLQLEIYNEKFSHLIDMINNELRSVFIHDLKNKITNLKCRDEAFRSLELFYPDVLKKIVSESRKYMRESWVDIYNIKNCFFDITKEQEIFLEEIIENGCFFTNFESWRAVSPEIENENGEINKVIKKCCQNAIEVMIKYDVEIKKMEEEADSFILKAAAL